MVTNKNYEIPVFQVIRQDETNGKFFVASESTFKGLPNNDVATSPAVVSLEVGTSNGWF